MPLWHTITMTHLCYFDTISGTCWKVSEFIDFDLKNRNSDLSPCFSALIWDFSQFIRIPLSKTMKPGFKNNWKFIIYRLVKVRWVTYKFIPLEILFLLTYHTQAKDIAVVKSGTRNDFRSSYLYDTPNKLSPWPFFKHG